MIKINKKRYLIHFPLLYFIRIKKIFFVSVLGVVFGFAGKAEAAVIFQDDFNDGNSNGWAICPFCGGPSASMNPVVSGGRNDSYAWSSRTYWQEESDPNYRGYWDACFGDTAINGLLREAYIHYYVRFSGNWIFPYNNSGIKSFVIGYTNNGIGGWQNHSIFLLDKWNQRRPYFDVYADPDGENWGGIPQGEPPYSCSTPQWRSFSWQTGRWYEIELYVKQNTGIQQNGILRTWVDSVPLIDCDHVYMGNNPMPFDRIELTNYISGSNSSWNPNGAQIYTDNVIISTTRVGGNPDPIPPAVPGNLMVR